MQEKNTEKNTICNNTDVLWDSPFSEAEKKILSQYIKRGIEDLPPWWKKLTQYVKERKTVDDVLENFTDDDYNIISNNGQLSTAKRCPGIIKHLSQSLVIRAPCDIFIEVINENLIRWSHANKYINICYHKSTQTGPVDFHIVKINIPIHYTTSVKCQACIIDPIFYNDNGYRISPGLLDDTTDRTTDINLITLFPKHAKKYYIQSNSVLALLQLDKKINTVKNTDLSDLYTKTKHSLSKSFF